MKRLADLNSTIERWRGLERSASDLRELVDLAEDDDTALAEDLERTGAARGQLPFDIPETKPPLRALFFDRDRNLWVELTVAQSADREADAFDPDGQYVGRRVWPGNVELGSSWVSGNTALGTLTDEDGVIKVVRVRFHEQEEEQ